MSGEVLTERKCIDNCQTSFLIPNLVEVNCCSNDLCNNCPKGTHNSNPLATEIKTKPPKGLNNHVKNMSNSKNGFIFSRLVLFLYLFYLFL